MESIERKLDKFYTKDDIAEQFCDVIFSRFGSIDSLVIEPSAGAGSFIGPIKQYWKNHLFLDIKGEHPEIVSQDFLKRPTSDLNSLFIGNPPFGKNSSLAVQFFNHMAASKPMAICMIFPKTFMKPRFWSRLDSSYVLDYQYELPKNSFTFCGGKYDAPCVAQIWVPGQRNSLSENLELFDSTLPAVWIRRVGASAGKLVNNFTKSSTYATGCSLETQEMLIRRYPDIRKLASMTAGVRSITLLEIEDVLLNRYVV